jgi:hypothetical protein
MVLDIDERNVEVKQESKDISTMKKTLMAVACFVCAIAMMFGLCACGSSTNGNSNSSSSSASSSSASQQDSSASVDDIDPAVQADFTTLVTACQPYANSSEGIVTDANYSTAASTLQAAAKAFVVKYAPSFDTTETYSSTNTNPASLKDAYISAAEGLLASANNCVKTQKGAVAYATAKDGLNTKIYAVTNAKALYDEQASLKQREAERASEGE